MQGMLDAGASPSVASAARRCLHRCLEVEELSDDEELVIVDHFAFGGPVVAPCNWFHVRMLGEDLVLFRDLDVGIRARR